VGKAVTMISGRSADYVRNYGFGSVGRNATFDFGDGLGGEQRLEFQVAIGGNLTVRMKKAAYNEVATSGPAKRAKITLLGDRNHAYLYGPSDAASLDYTGGDGVDDVSLLIAAPVRAATLKLKGGDDRVVTDSGLQLGRLFVDFGDGTDRFDDH